MVDASDSRRKTRWLASPISVRPSAAHYDGEIRNAGTPAPPRDALTTVGALRRERTQPSRQPQRATHPNKG